MVDRLERPRPRLPPSRPFVAQVLLTRNTGVLTQRTRRSDKVVVKNFRTAEEAEALRTGRRVPCVGEAAWPTI